MMKHQQKIERLRARKIAQTQEKLRRNGTQNEDDYGTVPIPEGFDWTPPHQRANGFFCGNEAWAENFRSLMEHHPVYLDPDDALAGRWMFMLSRMRAGYRLELSCYPEEMDYPHLKERLRRYDITCGIFKDAHFGPDYRIGLELGWGGLLDKVRHYQKVHADAPEKVSLLAAEEQAILGIQSWISRAAAEAETAGLAEIAAVNRHLIDGKPRTLREACQWLAWFNMASRTYNRDGAGGQLDELLRPYYERDLAAGTIDRDDAIYFVACLLLNDPHYYQLAGPDRAGNDMTSDMSFIVLEAARYLRSSANLTIRIHQGLDQNLFRAGLKCLLEEKCAFPRFSGDKALVEGFMRNGFSAGDARERIAVGCNWMSLPGREYTLNDLIKVNLAKVFDVALHEIRQAPSLERLEARFVYHLTEAIACAAEGVDFHLAHQHLNEPELLLNLLCHGPIEKGLDASNGGVEFYNIAMDAAGLATVADSFAAIEQRVVHENAITWEELYRALDQDFVGCETLRRMLAQSTRYGSGDPAGNRWAQRVSSLFSERVHAKRTPSGRLLIPGFFSWADALRLGKSVGATPNGRCAGQPISHGANPDPGGTGGLTSIASAIASIQPGYGNTAPWQLEVAPIFSDPVACIDKFRALIQTHFDMGGTLVNINIVDADRIREAHKNPHAHPELVVRVTGFTAYFANLSKEFRQLVVDRVLEEAV